ncbi:MAG: hypothetical protein WCS70_09765 [Verrucomicrobiota bacterium]
MNQFNHIVRPSQGYGLPSWQTIAEYDGAGSVTAKYVYGPGIDEPVRLTRGGTNYFYHADALGSVTEVTTNGGFKRLRRVTSCYSINSLPAGRRQLTFLLNLERFQ